MTERCKARRIRVSDPCAKEAGHSQAHLIDYNNGTARIVEDITSVDQVLSSVSIDVDVIRKAARRLEVAPSEAAKMRLIYSALGSIERAIDGLSIEIEGDKVKRITLKEARCD